MHASPPPIRLLICDDQEMVRKGLAIILTHQPGLQVVGLATNGREAVELAKTLQPTVILMDLKMPHLDGIAATQQILAHDPQLKIVILTTFDDDESVFQALQAGAIAFLLKDATSDEIVQAVRDAADGKSRAAPEIISKLIAVARTDPRLTFPPADRPDLTDREREILQLMANGRTNSEIADELHLALGTVKNHVSQILSKFEVADRTQAVVIALRLGLARL